MGCPDPASALSCLQGVLAGRLLDHMYLFDECNAVPMEIIPFPLVWKPSVGGPFFVPPGASDAAVESDVPVMVGFTKDDGLLSTAFLLKEDQIMQKFR